MTERISNLREFFFEGTHKEYRIEDSHASILSDVTRGLPFAVRKALAFEKALEIMPVFLQAGELIVGGKTLYQLPEYITNDEIKTGNHHFETKGYNNAFDNCYNLGQDDRGYGIINSCVPAYYRILPMGLPALVSDAERRLAHAGDEQSRNYYESVVIANRAVLRFMGRYEEIVRERAGNEPDPSRKAELSAMAGNIRHIRQNPPDTYWQAIQLMYFIHILIWTEGGYLVPLGRMDQVLNPYLQKDLETGTLEKPFALEILECFFIKLNDEIDRTHGETGKFESDTGQSITIGGVIPKTGEDASNELTLLMMDAKCDTRLTDPKLHLRIHGKTPDAVWKKAAYLTSLGMGFPTYENDDSIIPAFLSHNSYYCLEDARDYAASGCWEMIVQGRSFNRNLGMIDCLRCLEWALNDGQYFLGVPGAATAVGLMDGKYGIPTGSVEIFDRFDKLFNAFKVQMKHNIDMVSSYCNRSMCSPSPFYSSMMEDCLEHGRDFNEGGCRYNETDFQLSSLANAADALYAIRKLVYIDKSLSLRTFTEILKNNWTGQEPLRQKIINRYPKFGNDQDEVDLIARDIVSFYSREATKHRNHLDGPYRARISSALGYIAIASILGASADGRKARGFYSSNLSPQMGAEKSGPTAIIKSCGKIDFSRCAGGAVLDLKFHPSALKTTKSRDKFITLIKTYFSLGGLQIQVNVLDNRVLIDAKVHPENYGDLMVRVWGFSTYFVSLPEKYQDHIIERSMLGL